MAVSNLRAVYKTIDKAAQLKVCSMLILSLVSDGSFQSLCLQLVISDWCILTASSGFTPGEQSVCCAASL